jgi:hypothetical protein
MQREKNYNIQKTAYFIIALFVFKMDKTLSRQFLIFKKIISFFETQKLVVQNFVHFESKKWNYKISCPL